MESRIPVFVLVSGKRYSGKDTVADLLCTMLVARGRDAVCAAFADEVKREVADAHGLDGARLFTDAAYKEVHRAKLIATGMSRRDSDPAYWVTRLWNAYRHHEFVVISDWRFPDEDETIRRLGGRRLRVRVHANARGRRARGWRYNAGVDLSPSETALDSPWGDPTTFLDPMFVFNSEQDQWDVLQRQVERVAARCIKMNS